MDLIEAAAELHSTYLDFRSLWTAQSGKLDGLGGRFVLLWEHGGTGLRRAMAARIAGAAALLVLQNAEEAKAALRSGACDFVVSSLDEALRILKNEIRQSAPVSVCLCGSPVNVVAECVERGVQPDLLDTPQATLEGRGALAVRWRLELSSGEQAVCWTLPDGPLQRLAELDRVAGNALDLTAERSRWLATSPEVLGRPWQRYRFLPMNPTELERISPILTTSAELVITGSSL